MSMCNALGMRRFRFIYLLDCRFFSSQSNNPGSEETPSESDLLQQIKTRRKLSLMPHTESEVRTKPAPSLSPPLPADIVPESPARSVSVEPQASSRKRLLFPSDGLSVRNRLQEEFGYSKVKKFKPTPSATSHPLSQLDEAGGCVVGGTTVTSSPVRNPFAKIQSQKPAVPNCTLVQKDSMKSDCLGSQAEGEDSESNDTRSVGIPLSLQDSGSAGMSTDSQTIADCGSSSPFSGPLCTATSADIHPRQPFMTSADFIMTPATSQQQSATVRTLSDSVLPCQTMQPFSEPPLQCQQVSILFRMSCLRHSAVD